MDGLGGYNAKRNKSERKTNTVCIHLYVESKKYNKLVVTMGTGKGGGEVQGWGIKRYKLLCITQATRIFKSGV